MKWKAARGKDPAEALPAGAQGNAPPAGRAFWGRMLGRHPAVTACLYATAILLFMLLAGWVRWEGADDFTISQLLMGTPGRATPYVQVCSYVLCTWIVWLQQEFPVVNWFTVLEIASVWVLTATLECFLLRQTRKAHRAAALAFPLLFVPVLYLQLTYTRTAFWFTFSGALLLFGATAGQLLPEWPRRPQAWGWRVAKAVAGLALFALGAMFRYNCLYGSAAYVGILLFVYGVHTVLYDRKNLDVIIRLLGCVVLLLAALGISLWLNNYNQSVYETWNRTNDYVAYNHARGQVVDYLPAVYDEGLGISQNDYAMLKAGMVNDSYFSEEYLEQTSQKLDSWKQESSDWLLDNARQAAEYQTGRLKGQPTLLAVCVLLLAVALLLSTRKNRLALAADLAGTVVVVAYFLLNNRFPPWVADPVYLFASYIAVLQYCAFAPDRVAAALGVRRRWAVCAIAVVLCFCLRFDAFCRAVETNFYDANLGAALQRAVELDDAVLLDNVPSSPYPYIDVYGPLAVFSEGEWANLIRVGNWDVEHPARNRQKAALGIDSVLSSMITHRSKLLSRQGASSFAMLKTFFAEHYGVEVTFVRELGYGAYGIYSIALE